MKMSFVLNSGLYLKTGKWVLSQMRSDSNSAYVRKWKPDIALKKVKGFNIRRTPFII